MHWIKSKYMIRMKKLLLLSVLLGVCAVNMMAQDDLYFTPKKSEKTVKNTTNVNADDNTPAYHVGSNRSADEYNRRGKFGSYYEKIGTDSLGNDIIEFHPAAEDSLAIYTEADKKYDVDEDYPYSRRMSRFDDFYWYDPWFFGPYYGWHSPWWYSRWGWYDPWYYGWGYSGWYYGWYDWYDPFYYGIYGYRYPYYWGMYNTAWVYTRPYYIASVRTSSPGRSISTDRYYRAYNSRGSGGHGRYAGGTISPSWGNYSSSGSYSSSNVNRGYRRDTPTFSGDTGSSTRSSGSYSTSRSSTYSSGSHVGNRSSGSYSAPSSSYSSGTRSSGSYSAPSAPRSSGGGGGGGGSHQGRR